MALKIKESDINAMKSLADVLSWAQVPIGDPSSADNARGAFLTTIGGDESTLPRVLGVLPEADYLDVVNSVQINSTDADGNTTDRTLNLLQRASLILVGKVCRIVAGTDLSAEQEDKAKTVAAPVITNATNQPIGTGARKIKLAHVLRQADDTEIELLPETFMSRGYARYEVVHGSKQRPDPCCDVTCDQLTAINYLITHGAAPYCDFAVWGPHGHRIEKRIRLTGQVFGSNGQLQTKEISGPPSFEVWEQCYAVMMTAFTMLDICDLGTMTRYRDKIAGYHRRYGPQVWMLLYQSDVRCRLELWERKMRLALDTHNTAVAAGGTTPFVVTKPWNYSLNLATADIEWWQYEFAEQALLLITKLSSAGEVIDGDAPIAMGSTGHNIAHNIPHSFSQTTPGNRSNNGSSKRKRGGSEYVNASSSNGGRYTHNKAGAELCHKYNIGQCHNTKDGNICPIDPSRVHACSICLQTHPACKRHNNKGKGGGKGNKGKGKKGNKYQKAPQRTQG